MVRALNPAPPARRRAILAWLPLAAVALAWALTQLPLAGRIGQFLDDSTLRWAARPSDFGDVAVIDIDDASLQALKPRFGAWPYPRDLYALLLGYLRDAGARAVVFDVVFADGRDGDEALARALAARPDVALAAIGLPRGGPLSEPEAVPAGAALPSGAAAWPSLQWPALVLPTTALRPALNHPGAIGIVTAPLDDDGNLRRLPLFNLSHGQFFPALPLAALMVAHPDTRLSYDADARRAGFGALRWPLDDEGNAQLLHASNATALPTLPLRVVVDAALGASDDPAQHRLFAGRVVFIGNSAFFSSDAMTPQGRIAGTTLLASAYDALLRQAVLQPVGWPLQAALAGLGVLPACGTWRRGRPLLLRDARAALLGLLAVAGTVLAAATGWHLQTDATLALATLAFGLLLAALTELRWSASANRQLAYDKAVAQAANQAKTDFLAHVSHEIRTPMNALMGMAEMLSRTELKPEQRRYVDLFSSAGDTLFTLINDLLDLSKIEAGKLELRSSIFSLPKLLAEQRELMLERALQKGLTIELLIEPKVGDAVRGDPERLAQVLLNLLGNAIKFTPAGRVTVQAERDGIELRLTVRDTGVGIPPEELAPIFEPYWQAPQDGLLPARHSGSGTGLGLPITKRLVQLMGGTIEVDSDPGRGSTFLVRLPLPISDEAPEAAATSPIADAATTEPPRSLAILIADDNPINVLVVEAMMQNTGHRIDIADSGETALEKFRAGHYDLVLMDVQMPGMGGLAATREIRRFERHSGRPATPVLALTANAFDNDERQSLAAGCDGHLTKPIGRERLLRAIHQHARPAA